MLIPWIAVGVRGGRRSNVPAHRHRLRDAVCEEIRYLAVGLFAVVCERR